MNTHFNSSDHFLQTYAKLVLHVVRRYTLPVKCPITRDDLIQEGYLAILEKQAQHSSNGLPEPSEADLYAVARKAMQRSIRCYALTQHRHCAIENCIANDASSNPEEQIVLQETQQQIRQFFCNLSESKRYVVLRMMEDQSITSHQIAKELNISPARVRGIKHELRRKLKALM